MTTSGIADVTDSLGRYSIPVLDTDSIWFSYLGKPTPKYAVKSIPNINQFELSLHVSVTNLPAVTVKSPNYRMDSLFKIAATTINISITRNRASVPVSVLKAALAQT